MSIVAADRTTTNVAENSNQHCANEAQTAQVSDSTLSRDVGTACVVCLEEFDDESLYIHTPCSCLLCMDCIAQLKAHHGSTEEGQCPLCNRIVNFDEEFVAVDVITGQSHRSRWKESLEKTSFIDFTMFICAF